MALASSLWYAWLVWQFRRRPSTLKTYEWAGRNAADPPRGRLADSVPESRPVGTQRLGYFEAKVAQLIRITNDILANKGRDALAQRQDKLEGPAHLAEWESYRAQVTKEGDS